MTGNKNYPITSHSATELFNHMNTWLAEDQRMDTRCIKSDDGYITIVHARTKGGKFKQFVGLDKTVTLRFIEKRSTVNVTIGGVKWIDKLIVIIISLSSVLWPLTLTSCIGFYRQKKLISDLNAEMDSYMMNFVDGNNSKQTGDEGAISFHSG